MCDYVTPNETEAEAYSGISINTIEDARRAADSILAKGVGTVVITMGGNGVLLHNQDCSKHIQAFPVQHVVDTTGAGDAFNGAFAAALSVGENAEYAARFACAGAALSVTREGASNAMPLRSEILEFIG